MATQESLNESYDILMENIAWLRKTHGLSKTEMAKLLHISVRSLNRMERGEMPPGTSVDIIFLAQDTFAMDAEVLMCRRLEEQPENKTQKPPGSGYLPGGRLCRMNVSFLTLAKAIIAYGFAFFKYTHKINF